MHVLEIFMSPTVFLICTRMAKEMFYNNVVTSSFIDRALKIEAARFNLPGLINDRFLNSRGIFPVYLTYNYKRFLCSVMLFNYCHLWIPQFQAWSCPPFFGHLSGILQLSLSQGKAFAITGQSGGGQGIRHYQSQCYLSDFRRRTYFVVYFKFPDCPQHKSFKN